MEYLNPDTLYTDKDNFIVVLNSKFATTIYNPGYNSSCEFDLPEPIRRGKTDIKLCCSVLSFVCPNSIYNVNETNNILSVTNSYIGTVPQTNPVLYTIPVGNYNSQTLISTLLSILPSGFSISFNTINNKYTFNYTQTFSINSTSTAYQVLGFKANTTYLSTSNSLAAPYTCNFNGVEQINILLTSVNTNNIDCFSGNTKSSIIQPVQIPLGTNQILYQKTNEYNFMISQDMLDDLKIELRDSNNNLVNLNNQHFNLVLMFTVVRDIYRFRNSNSFHEITGIHN
jgi:hypothetical protein